MKDLESKHKYQDRVIGKIQAELNVIHTTARDANKISTNCNNNVANIREDLNNKIDSIYYKMNVLEFSKCRCT